MTAPNTELEDEEMLRLAEERMAEMSKKRKVNNLVADKHCVVEITGEAVEPASIKIGTVPEPYDFEPLFGWSMKHITSVLLEAMCYNCTQRPPDKPMCLQRFCYRRECVENSLREVERI